MITNKSDGKQILITTKGIEKSIRPYTGRYANSATKESLFYLDQLLENAKFIGDEKNKHKNNPKIKKANIHRVDVYAARYTRHKRDYEVKIKVRLFPATIKRDYTKHNFYWMVVEDIETEPTVHNAAGYPPQKSQRAEPLLKGSVSKPYTPNGDESREVQKSAYRVEHREFKGLPISIEQRKGGVRKWRDPLTGRSGETKFHYPYGYIRGTEGEDRDHVDCFLGPNEQSDKVYVVEQVSPETGLYDEDKVMLGFDSEEQAKAAYLAHYDRFFGSIHYLDFSDFLEILPKHGEGRKLLREYFVRKSLCGLDFLEELLS